MFRSPFRSPFRDSAFRPVFGASGGETALQQAVIGAWDMQETTAGDDLVPAKGGITIPAVGAPGVASGLVTGFTARDLTTGPTDHFSVASSELFLAPASGVKTIRIWAVETEGNISNQAIFGKSQTTNTSTAGDEYCPSYNSGTRVRTYVRNSADSATENAVVGNGILTTDNVFRYEIEFRAGDGITQYLYNLTTNTEGTETTSFSLSNFNRGTNDFQIGRIGTQSFSGSVLLMAIFNRALTTEEREADKTPTRFADLGK